MLTASQDLVREHNAILEAMQVLERFCVLLGLNDKVNINDISETIDFLRVFVDSCHHGKEEIYYFPALESVGIRNENGPIGNMLTQHEEGRNLIKDMVASISDGIIDKTLFINAASSYVFHLRAHIERENQILFPMGDSRLDTLKHSELLASFENHEKNVIGDGKHEDLHKLLTRLKKQYLF